MQKLLIIPVLFISLICLSFHMDSTETGELVLEVNNIKLDSGIIWIGIYDSEANFLIKERAIVEGFKVDNQQQLNCLFSALPYGTYGIAIFHDENENGELDTNFLGIPKEPYGFSGKVQSKWRLPKFQEVKFNFNTNKRTLPITLERW